MRETLDEWRPAVDAAIEEVLPREIDEEYLTEYFGEPTYHYDTESIQRVLVDPIWDLLDRGGKRWRAVLVLVFIEGFGEDPSKYIQYATIPEILHNGTIVVDDVEDEARMRRGEPALHRQFGADIALNAGNAMYFIPLKLISHGPADLPADIRLRAYDMLMHELNRTHLGQGMDLCWHNDTTIHVNEDDYLEMAACKTGCLGRIVARLAAILTDQPSAVEEEIAAYAEKVSIAFQIGDDILDIEHSLGEAGAFGKEFGNDVREGKRTLMVIHASDNAPPERARRLREILDAPDNTDEEILEAIEIIQAAGSIDYAREVALELAAEARTHLDGVNLEPAADEKLRSFTRYVIDRDL